MNMKKQTAGRDALGEFAPKFAQLNDDILFGEVWSREEQLSARDRSLITVTALMAQGLTDTSFQHHLMAAKQNGMTSSEIAEKGGKRPYYAGWPKAWAAFRMAKEIWAENTGDGGGNNRTAWYSPSVTPTTALPNISPDRAIWRPSPPARWGSSMSPLSRAAGITGISIRLMRAADRSSSAWPDGATNRKWAKSRKVHPGDIVDSPTSIKHWHGAAPDSWFSHLAVEVPGENGHSEWCEPVTEEDYKKLR